MYVDNTDSSNMTQTKTAHEAYFYLWCNVAECKDAEKKYAKNK